MKHLALYALMGTVLFAGNGAQAAALKPDGKNAKTTAPAAIDVIVSPARQDQFVDQGEALGTLKARESLVLTSSVTETVSAINFEDGQRVNAGDVLVEMTSGEESANLQEERSNVNEARKQYERLKTLAVQGGTSKSLLDAQRRDYETAQARLKSIESRLEDRLIRAPFSGVVGLRNTSVGALVQPGTEITTLDDDSVMKLDFTVPSVFLEELHIGLPISATSNAFPGKTFTGEVSAMASQIDPITRSITVRALLPNDERLLKPGLLMRVALLKNSRTAIVIPEESLIPEGQDNFVYVAQEQDGKTVALKRKVQIGSRRPGDVEILSGLQAGERVVTHGNFKLKDMTPIKITAVEKGGEALGDLLKSLDKPKVDSKEKETP